VTRGPWRRPLLINLVYAAPLLDEELGATPATAIRRRPQPSASSFARKVAIRCHKSTFGIVFHLGANLTRGEREREGLSSDPVRNLVSGPALRARTLLRNTGFTAVSIFALALGIGVNTVVFTAYKAFIARPLDARDPGTMANFALCLQSGVSSTTFSYPDYEAYRDHLHSFSGVITCYLDQFKLTGAGGIVSQAGCGTSSSPCRSPSRSRS
jgi:hypothetical protein